MNISKNTTHYFRAFHTNRNYSPREGNFAEVENWEEKNKFAGNFISSADIKDKR